MDIVSRVFSNEGHTVIFESKYQDEQWYWKVSESKDQQADWSLANNYLMTDEGGQHYMDQLIKQGYLGYN